MPRTGSTALSFLLAEDPGTRSLRLWESARAGPAALDGRGPDPRIAWPSCGEQQQEFSPRSAALVPSTATGPMECQELMALDFKSQIFLAFAYLPSYSNWFLYEPTSPPRTGTSAARCKLLQWGTPAGRGG